MLVTTRFFKWRDGRQVEQVTEATNEGLRVSYVVGGVRIEETVSASSMPEPSKQPDEPIFTAPANKPGPVNMDPEPADTEPEPEVSRVEAANIRGMWAGLFGAAASMGSEGIVYALNNLTTLHIPSGYALAAGAGLTGLLTGTQYWAKKYAKPDGKW